MLLGVAATAELAAPAGRALRAEGRGAGVSHMGGPDRHQVSSTAAPSWDCYWARKDKSGAQRAAALLTSASMPPAAAPREARKKAAKQGRQDPLQRAPAPCGRRHQSQLSKPETDSLRQPCQRPSPNPQG